MVGTVLCSLATDVEDRATVWRPSARRCAATGKCSRRCRWTEALALVRVDDRPAGTGRGPRLCRAAPPPFNVVISNVPEAAAADVLVRRADVNYPVSIRMDNLAPEHHPSEQ